MTKQAKRKEETRKNLLNAASRGFRSKGFHGIGVDGIAKEAGATSGAFYAHLGSKDGAFTEALKMGLEEVIETVPEMQKEHGDEWVTAFANYYLGRDHRDDLETGCAMTSLSPEVVRSADEFHELYEQYMAQIADLMAKGLSGNSMEARRMKAWTMLNVLIGGLTTSRAVASPDLADKIAEATIETALTIAAG